MSLDMDPYHIAAALLLGLLWACFAYVRHRRGSARSMALSSRPAPPIEGPDGPDRIEMPREVGSGAQRGAVVLFLIAGLACCSTGCAARAQISAVREVVIAGARSAGEVGAALTAADRQRQVEIANSAAYREDSESALRAYRESHLRWWQALRDRDKRIWELLARVVGPRRLTAAELSQVTVELTDALRAPLAILAVPR